MSNNCNTYPTNCDENLTTIQLIISNNSLSANLDLLEDEMDDFANRYLYLINPRFIKLFVDDKDNVVLIEANFLGQGIWFPQIINGCSPFQDQTDQILEIIKSYIFSISSDISLAGIC